MADRLCDRLAIVDGGILVAEGAPETLKEEVGADRVTVVLESGEIEAARATLADLGTCVRPRTGPSRWRHPRARPPPSRSWSVCGRQGSGREAFALPARRSTTSSLARPARRASSARRETLEGDRRDGVLAARALREVPRLPTRIVFVLVPVLQSRQQGGGRHVSYATRSGKPPVTRLSGCRGHSGEPFHVLAPTWPGDRG